MFYSTPQLHWNGGCNMRAETQFEAELCQCFIQTSLKIFPKQRVIRKGHEVHLCFKHFLLIHEIISRESNKEKGNYFLFLPFPSDFRSRAIFEFAPLWSALLIKCLSDIFTWTWVILMVCTHAVVSLEGTPTCIPKECAPASQGSGRNLCTESMRGLFTIIQTRYVRVTTVMTYNPRRCWD